MKLKLASIVRLKTGNNHEWENQLGIITDLWTRTKDKVKTTKYRVAVESSEKELYRATTFEVTEDKLELVVDVDYRDLSPYVIHRYAIDRGNAKINKHKKEVLKVNKELYEKYLILVNKNKRFKVEEKILVGEWVIRVYNISFGNDSIEIRNKPVLDEGIRLADFYEYHVNSRGRHENWDTYIGKLLRLMNAVGRLYNCEKASIVKRYLKNKENYR